MRGTHVIEDWLSALDRFIPACAGNSATRVWVRVPRSVHPRVCGELRLPRLSSSVELGSSPRVRGTHDTNHAGSVASRFIPACAGNSCGGRHDPGCSPVHPRVCGELAAVQGDIARPRGSSPRVRGTRLVGANLVGARRFIPACAGNSLEFSRKIKSAAVHPRVCGELADQTKRAMRTFGSSPRVRGTLTKRPQNIRRYRFIPACAGNSSSVSNDGQSDAVHPRVCGELPFATLSSGNGNGSSPRVRGTQQIAGCAASQSRFIPACAGNSWHHISRRRDGPVHPRVCGELPSLSSSFSSACGSSPRVRGTHG